MPEERILYRDFEIIAINRMERDTTFKRIESLSRCLLKLLMSSIVNIYNMINRGINAIRCF